MTPGERGGAPALRRTPQAARVAGGAPAGAAGRADDRRHLPRLVDSAAGAGCARLPERLPWRLGLTQSPDGGWGDFVGLHPNRELPLYAAQAPDGALGPRRGRRCVRYLRAHHLGGFAWLLRDRTRGRAGRRADDRPARAGRRLRAALARGAGATATGDAPLAEALCRRATARWQRGTRRREAPARRRFGARADLRGDRPGEAELDRRAVAGAAAWRTAIARRVTAFLHAHDLFMLGLQAIDDVVDTNQDRALRGGDVPTALGCSPGALVRVGAEAGASGPPRPPRTAASPGSRPGCDAFADAIASWRLDGDRAGRRAGRHRHRGRDRGGGAERARTRPSASPRRRAPAAAPG